MKLIVGLGNPGEKYDGTRHNLGFMVLEQFLKDSSSVQDSNWHDEKKLKSEIHILDWQPKAGKGERVILARPKTYMNNSGMAVSLLKEYYKVDPDDIWVVHDELDLPLGTMKIRNGGAAAGHHGVEDIIDKIGTDKFWRFRLGIGVSRNHAEIAGTSIRNAEDFVLANFVGKDRTEAKKLIKHAADALTIALEKDMTTAMNRFNTK